MHNIGELMIHSLVPEQASEITARVEAGEDPTKVQREVLDTDSQQLGAVLAETWKFPSDMIDAIANVNHPGQANESKHLACTLFLARDIHRRWDSMLTSNEKQHYLESSAAAKALKVSTNLIEEIDAIRGQGVEMAYELF